MVFKLRRGFFLSFSLSDTPHYEQILPKGWCWTVLGDIFQHNNGKQKTSSNQEGELYKYITTSNVYWNKFDFSEVKQMRFLESEFEKYIAKKGDLLVCEGGDIGRAAIWNYDYNICIQNHLHRLRAYIPVCTKYFLFSLMDSKAKGVIKGKGIGLMSLSANDLHNIIIALPPLSEQYRIVTEIERWFTLISQIEQDKSALQSVIKQAKSKILRLAIYGKLVPQDPNDEPASELLKRINPNAEITCDNGHYPAGWQQTILGELFNHNTGKALNSVNRDGVMKDYLTTSNVYWNKFDFTVIKQMSFKESELDKCTVTKGDLLVCEGGDIGRSAIWNYDYDICIQNHIHRLRPKIDLCVPFYYYTLAYLKENNLIGGKGIGLLGLSSNALHKIEIPLPPLAEQQRIVQKIKKLFSVLDNIQKALEV